MAKGLAERKGPWATLAPISNVAVHDCIQAPEKQSFPSLMWPFTCYIDAIVDAVSMVKLLKVNGDW